MPLPPPCGRHEQHLPPCMLNDISSENVIQAWPRWVSSDDDSSNLPPPSSIIFFPTTKPSEQAIYWPHFSRSPSNQSKIFRHICHLQAMTRHFSYTIFHQYTHFLFCMFIFARSDVRCPRGGRFHRPSKLGGEVRHCQDF